MKEHELERVSKAFKNQQKENENLACELAGKEQEFEEASGTYGSVRFSFLFSFASVCCESLRSGLYRDVRMNLKSG